MELTQTTYSEDLLGRRCYREQDREAKRYWPEQFLSQKEVSALLQGKTSKPPPPLDEGISTPWKIAIATAFFFTTHIELPLFRPLTENVSTIDHSQDHERQVSIEEKNRWGYPTHHSSYKWIDHTGDRWVQNWTSTALICTSITAGLPLMLFSAYHLSRAVQHYIYRWQNQTVERERVRLFEIEYSLKCSTDEHKPYSGAIAPIVPHLTAASVQKLSLKQLCQLQGESPAIFDELISTDKLSNSQMSLLSRSEAIIIEGNCPAEVAALLTHPGNNALFFHEPYIWQLLIEKLPAKSLADKKIANLFSGKIASLSTPLAALNKQQRLKAFAKIVELVRTKKFSIKKACSHLRGVECAIKGKVKLRVTAPDKEKRREFIVERALLARESSYFRALFHGSKYRESNNKTINITEIDPDDFEIMLDYLNGHNSSSTIECDRALHLAFYFEITSWQRSLEKVLCTPAELAKRSEKQLLKLCQRYHLPRLFRTIDGGQTFLKQYDGSFADPFSAEFGAMLKLSIKYSLEQRLKAMATLFCQALTSMATDSPIAQGFFDNLELLWRHAPLRPSLREALNFAVDRRHHLLGMLWEQLLPLSLETAGAGVSLASWIAEIYRHSPQIALANWDLPPKQLLPYIERVKR